MLRTAVSRQLAFAAWRLPEQETMMVSISRAVSEVAENFKVETAAPGFIVHPFEVSGENKAYFLKTGLFFQISANSREISGALLSEDLPAAEFISELQH